MFYKDSYSTTIGKVFDTKELSQVIKKLIITDDIDRETIDTSAVNSVSPIFITGFTDNASELKIFNHPLYFQHEDKEYVASDLRLTLRKDGKSHDIASSIKNVTEYNLIKSRTVLNLLWLGNRSDEVKVALSFAGLVYSTWLADVISKAYALDFNDKQTLTVVGSIFYQSLFIDDVILSEDDKQRIVAHTIKMTGADSDLVFRLTDQMESVNTINALADKLEDLVGSSRLKNVNLAVLLTLLRNSWFGNNSKEIIGVSLELPPTWCALVYTALTERTYKNSTIARIAELLGKRGKAEEFIVSFKRIMESTAQPSMESLLDFDLI